MALSVDSPAQYIKGVGPKLGQLLKKKGIETVRDLLELYPRAYEDRRAARSISSLQAGDYVGLTAHVLRVSAIPMGRTKRKIYDVALRDETGVIHCKYFRVPYRGYFDRFQPHTKVRVVGKVTLYRNNLEFHHPEISEIKENESEKDELIPIYSETEGLTSKKLQTIIKSAIDSLDLRRGHEDIERIPKWILRKYKLPSLSESIQLLHQPKMGLEQEYLDRKTPYHHRVIFDEFFNLEMILASRKKGVQSREAPAIKINKDLELQFLNALPFELTGAQQRVIEEIKSDVSTNVPMNRLVQGDVGSGKTMVALITALHAIDSNLQVALMAPTEILAQQHYQNAKKVLSPMGFDVAFLSGQLKTAEKRDVLERVQSGSAQLVVGTHALIQQGVEFKDLGLVIVDEQHRFGVEQRSGLRQKGKSPHFLLMTATPIPRSLAMTVYGDLDCSIIDELPKGRQPIVTRVTNPNKKSKVISFVRDHLQKGRQAYIIFPLVEESEKIDLKSAVTEFEHLKNEFSEFRLGLLHGKMKAEEKDKIMEEFRDHKLDILVSTTVIEVGVDVPNANIMWIEHAERFGLSQLHQLRGRVGRGEHKSYCILMMGWAKSPEAMERVQIMETTADGFKIAEHDLEIRGPGEFLGVRQSGLPGFKMANLVRDLDILKEARTAAFELLDQDPKMKKADHQKLKADIEAKQARLS